MTAPLGVLPVGLALATTSVGDVVGVEYIDGGPIGR
jgi:hypothetical protein